jgi:hypothetical protein
MTTVKRLQRGRTAPTVAVPDGKPRPGAGDRPPKHELAPHRTSIERAASGRHAGAIQLLMNMMFVRHLIAVYRAFGGDLVAAIVLGEVAHHNLAPLISGARTPRELSVALRAQGAALDGTFLPTNTFSIAEATGIPRETVRRKVASLTRRGWMVKDADGNLFVAASAEASFETFHVARLRDLLEAARAIETLLHDC